MKSPSPASIVAWPAFKAGVYHGGFYAPARVHMLNPVIAAICVIPIDHYCMPAAGRSIPFPAYVYRAAKIINLVFDITIR
ncbi:hypothetical protein D3C73_1457060 [compost metagenome]